ncbi:MAG: phosphotransferase [bacterium]|nr:phosphotransferase [bacterium]
MADALRGRLAGWESVRAADVCVEDFSGRAGGKVHRLTNQAEPLARPAALHVVHEFFCPAAAEPIFFDRMRLAQERFADAGLGPCRIAEDPQREWFVEEWAGCNPSIAPDLDLCEEVGRLIARVHAIEPTWYDEIRSRKCERYPALREASRTSYIWRFASMPQHFFELIPPEWQRRWIEAGPSPITEAGSSLVTIHGDVHHANLVRDGDGLKLVDLESACVSSAIQDIAFSMDRFCRTNEQRDVFVRAYLVECGLPASGRDVFALRLDAERCRMSADFEGDLLATLRERMVDAEDLGPTYRTLVQIAARAFESAPLAEEIVRDGFEGCAPVREVRRVEGRPGLGMLVAVHRNLPARVERTHFVVNWDGTIQPSWESWRGFVLGASKSGEVVLASYLNDRERLRLRMDVSATPVTGQRAPSALPVPLSLGGVHAGKAIVRSPHEKGVFRGRDWQHLGVGTVGHAIVVHFEPDGVLRLADQPRQAVQCEPFASRDVDLWPHSGEAEQRFVLNDDRTLSPILDRDLVWGVRDSTLILVARNHDAALVFGDEFVAAARAEGAGAVAEDAPPDCDGEGRVLELASHPGYVLSTVPWEDREDVRRLVLVPVAHAERFIVAADQLRRAQGGGLLALGVPT